MHDSRVAHEREITWYWDPVEKIVRNQKFNSDGEWGQATIEVSEGSLRGRRKFVDKVGDPYTSRFVYKRTGPDSYSFDEDDALSLDFRRKE
jgi:hypothetical protein